MRLFTRNNCLIFWHIIALLLLAVFINCCSKDTETQENQTAREELANKLYRNKNEDSLKVMLTGYIRENNEYAAMLCYKQLGLFMRENARFSEAIHNHQEGLTLALKLNDTIEIVQAYNNLGTDFRRIGAQGEASDYHYQALSYAEAYSEVNELGSGMKNRVVSLNGIGNVNLTLGYLDEAEKHFSMALKDEIKLNSHIGQAINYANLGAVYELKGQLDSAHAYYNKSLEMNKIAKSDMGIGLCLIHIGQLYEKELMYNEAKIEYQHAYELMDQIVDKWHWLVACLSIARINLLENNIPDFNKYIDLAEETAIQINSLEHLAEVYKLKHEFDYKRRNYNQALHNYKLHSQMRDSVQGIQKANQLLDVRIGYEQRKNAEKLMKVEAQNKAEQEQKQMSLYITWAIFFVGIIMSSLLYYAYRQRSRSNKMLKQLEQTRSDFFTNITHEFRTPLTVIQGFNRLLRDRDDLHEKEKRTYRSAIERQCNNLLNLVTQLLDISKLKSGKDMPNWKRGDIVSYLRMTSETFTLFAEEKNVRLIFYSDMVSQEMDFIPFYVDKIISNLLSNAIKHTVAGDKIDFIVMKGNRPDTITIRVSDTGEGIPKEDINHIFELFYQSENAKNVSGTGIGLSFTKMMIEKMKGSIIVESEVGKGTAFTVVLPVKNKDITHIQPLMEMNSLYSLTHKDEDNNGKGNLNNDWYEHEVYDNQSPIVLVVEDNKDVGMYIKSLIGNSYRVHLARNGQEGLEMAEKLIPDLVISDIMMPVKDGIQMCNEMKHSVMLNHIPIIMLTAKSSDEDRIKGLHCGAEAYIKKPFHPEELTASIHNLLTGREMLIQKYRETMENNMPSSTKFESDSNLKYLQTITDIIYSEIQNPLLSSSFIADKMSISLSQLNRKLNGITGHSTISYILQVKLNKAKKMLQDSANSVADIAYSCGFNDPNYFSRVFKKEFGTSPSQFQKMPKL